MAGFLDAKQRFLDTILTTEGRRQLATGKLRAEFFSFSDAGIFYDEDTIVSGGLPAVSRPQLEACNLPQDTISFEADDNGKLISKQLGDALFGITSSVLSLAPGQILLEVSGVQEALTGERFLSTMDDLLASSVEHYQRCQILGSPELIDEDRKRFVVSPSNPEPFTITDNKPIKQTSLQEAWINQVEGFFQDKRLSHIPNFQFLPPVNKARLGETERAPLATYQRIEQAPILTIDELEEELQPRIESGYGRTVYFSETSKLNRFFAQFFEVGEDGLAKKLDIIDFGSFPSNHGVSKRIFFVGKVFTDDYGVDTFVNLFTLIFE